MIRPKKLVLPRDFAKLIARRRANRVATHKHMADSISYHSNVQQALDDENNYNEQHRMQDRLRMGGMPLNLARRVESTLVAERTREERAERAERDERAERAEREREDARARARADKDARARARADALESEDIREASAFADMEAAVDAADRADAVRAAKAKAEAVRVAARVVRVKRERDDEVERAKVEREDKEEKQEEKEEMAKLERAKEKEKKEEKEEKKEKEEKERVKLEGQAEVGKGGKTAEKETGAATESKAGSSSDAKERTRELNRESVKERAEHRTKVDQKEAMSMSIQAKQRVEDALLRSKMTPDERKRYDAEEAERAVKRAARDVMLAASDVRSETAKKEYLATLIQVREESRLRRERESESPLSKGDAKRSKQALDMAELDTLIFTPSKERLAAYPQAFANVVSEYLSRSEIRAREDLQRAQANPKFVASGNATLRRLYKVTD